MNTQLDSALQGALQDWQKWPVTGQPKFIKQFNSGLNHKTALIKDSDRLLVLKAFSSDAEKALAAQRWAARIELSPAIVFESDQADYCLMEYISENCLAGQKVDNRDLQALASSLHSMHSAPAVALAEKTGEFNILYWCNQYLPVAGKEAAQLHRALLEILDKYVADDTGHCLCHNDLVAENCFISGGHAVFIDWEFAQWHNPWFDLASIIYYLKLDTKLSSLLLKTYRPGWEEAITTPIFYSSQIALLWGDMLWHLAKFGEHFWPSLADKLCDLQGLARQLGTELPVVKSSI